MDAENEIGRQMASIRRHLAEGEPEALRDAYLAAPSADRPMLQGSTVAAIVPSWQERASGLVVPSSLRSTQMLDLVLVYLTFEEIFGQVPPVDFHIRQLRSLQLESVLRFSAELLNALSQPGAVRSEVDAACARAWFKGEARTRVLNMLRDKKRGLVVPQALMLLVRSAVEHCPDELPADTQPGNLIAALLALTQTMGAGGHTGPAVVSDQPGDLGRELIANQYFNQITSIPNLLGRSVRRWRELPGELAGQHGVVDLASIYEICTGVSLDELTMVGGALWLAVTHGNYVIPAADLDALRLPDERLNAVLSLISADLATLRTEVRAERERQYTEWTFDAFQQRPVIRLADGNLLILDQRHLLNRIFGWLPIMDIRHPPQGRPKPPGHKSMVSQAEDTLRHLSEVYVSEVLHSITGDTSVRRVYDDAHLKDAFSAHGQQIADAAIDYGDVWVVVEVTTSQLQRKAATAVPGPSQVQDIDKLLDELQQIHATIRALREDETRLTGAAAKHLRRFLPLLLLSEGFPVNPVSLTVIRERARARGLLQDADVLPIEVLDVEELEMIEALQEHAGMSLLSVLQQKQASDLDRMAMRDFIISDLNVTTAQAQRLSQLWPKALQPLEKALLENERRRP